MSPILKGCVEFVDGHVCGVLSEQSRCPEHRRSQGRDLLRREPWRRLYKTWQWQRTVAAILARDDDRCTFEVDGARCGETEGLSVNHDRKLRLLWRDAKGNEKRFTRIATDPKILRTLCGVHHKQVDKSLSQEDAAPAVRRRSVSRGRSRSTSRRRRAA